MSYSRYSNRSNNYMRHVYCERSLERVNLSNSISLPFCVDPILSQGQSHGQIWEGGANVVIFRMNHSNHDSLSFWIHPILSHQCQPHICFTTGNDVMNEWITQSRTKPNIIQNTSQFYVHRVQHESNPTWSWVRSHDIRIADILPRQSSMDTKYIR